MQVNGKWSKYMVLMIWNTLWVELLKLDPKQWYWERPVGLLHNHQMEMVVRYSTILALVEIPFIKNSNWVEAPG